MKSLAITITQPLHFKIAYSMNTEVRGDKAPDPHIMKCLDKLHNSIGIEIDRELRKEI